MRRGNCVDHSARSTAPFHSDARHGHRGRGSERYHSATLRVESGSTIHRRVVAPAAADSGRALVLEVGERTIPRSIGSGP